MSSLKDLSEKTVSISRLLTRIVALSRLSSDEFDRFGPAMKTAGAGAGKVPHR